jgi:Zn-dependent protease with chaperone function
VAHNQRVAAVRGGRTSVLRICLELPAFLLSAGLMVVVGLVVGFWPWGALVIGVWVASGPVILLRRVEELIMKGRESLRLPTEPERLRLADSWSAVTKAGGVNPSNYSLWIQKSHRINAYATAGHTVAVTEAAVRKLSASQLEAILAHELGHHLGGHAWASLLRYRYSLPAMYVFQFATYLSLALSTALRCGSVAMGATVGVLVLGLLGYLIVAIPVAGISAAVLVVIPFGLLWARRVQEYEADAIAAKIGYKDALVHLLMITTPSIGRQRSRWLVRLGETHPTNSERVGRLQVLPNPDGQPAD